MDDALIPATPHDAAAATAAEWTARSRAHVWHPCTQMQDHESQIPLLPIASAEGVWLIGHDGRRYLDAVGSWWTNIFGHRHPLIVDRLKAQLDVLDHVIFAGFTHEPAVKLAEKLCALAPTGLNRCFFADNGSAAVEVALKMSAHYWRNRGAPAKTKFIALSNGYHGETLGALAVGGTGMYRDAYAPMLMQPIYVQSPDCFERAPGASWEDHTRQAFRHMEAALARHAHEVAAVIVEPLVQCAGGMRMYHPVYLSLLREACTRHGVHLIADEIAVGFGRTGRLFACEWAEDHKQASTARRDLRRPATDGLNGGSGDSLAKDGNTVSGEPARADRPGPQRPRETARETPKRICVSPDFMCLSKGLTGGTMALAAVLTTDDVYAAFYDDYASGKAFLHSHSYTANPIACAAALATLEIFEQRDWHAQNRGLGHLMWMSVSELLSHPHVAEVRQQGMILAIELAKNPNQREPYPAAERRGLKVYRHALNAHKDWGAVLRPLGNVVYFMPPYTITPEQLAQLGRIAIEGIDQATRN